MSQYLDTGKAFLIMDCACFDKMIKCLMDKALLTAWQLMIRTEFFLLYIHSNINTIYSEILKLGTY